MASELKVDKIFNAGGDQDSGINLATNDTIKFDIATSTKATMASTGIVTIVGEGGTTTTNLQQGLAKCWAEVNMPGTPAILDSFNYSSITDDAQGRTGMTINNNMNNAFYSKPGSESDGSAVHCFTQGPATTTYQVNMYDGSAYVDKDFSTSVLGDLA